RLGCHRPPQARPRRTHRGSTRQDGADHGSGSVSGSEPGQTRGLRTAASSGSDCLRLSLPTESAQGYPNTNGELRYSINDTVDGCCDHRVGVISDDFHLHHANNRKRADGLIFGRITYQMMEDAWRQPDGDTTPEADLDPFVAAIDPARKYVVSSTLDRVDWNSELIRDDLEIGRASCRLHSSHASIQTADAC